MTDHQAFLERTLSDFSCATGTVHLLGEDGLLHLTAQVGIPPHLMPVIGTIPVGKGIAGCAAERMAPVELCNLQTDTSGVAKPGAKQTQVQGSLAVPMRDAAGKLRGVVGIGKKEPYRFSEEEQARLMRIAGELAQLV